jgi:hypothetical protein
MLGQLAPNSFGWSYSLQANPSTTPGVSVTPGSGAEGSYAQLASGANLTQDVYLIHLWVNAGNTTTGIRDILVDIGTDPAGGTSYSQTAGISDIFCPQASNAVQCGYFMWFPMFIKAGSSVGARAQASSASTVRVMARFYGQPSQPHAIRAGQYSETVGVSGNGGTPITCGNTAAEGSWTSIGTTTRDCWNWTLCSGHNVGTTTAQMYFFDLAYGDASNKHIIIENQPHLNPGTAEATGGVRYSMNWMVPAGGTLYVRGSASGTAETTEVVAVGIGG